MNWFKKQEDPFEGLARLDVHRLKNKLDPLHWNPQNVSFLIFSGFGDSYLRNKPKVVLGTY